MHVCDTWSFSAMSRVVLHLDYASKPKNSTEAICKWNPQLLSCQPNRIIVWSGLLQWLYKNDCLISAQF